MRQIPKLALSLMSLALVPPSVLAARCVAEEALSADLLIKGPVSAVATSTIALTGEQVINGVSVESGDRVLVAAQSDAAENGIYVASDGAWSRAGDWSGDGDVSSQVRVPANTPNAPYAVYRVVGKGLIKVGETPVHLVTVVDSPILYEPTLSETAAGLSCGDLIEGYPPGDIRRYGATLDDATLDSAAVQKAIDSGHPVFIPAGVTRSDTLNLTAGTTIYGEGPESTLELHRVTSSSYGLLYANSGSDATQLDGIEIRHLQLLGTVTSEGFSEFTHLVSLHGVKGVLVEDCLFRGFQGDGIYLGSGVSLSSERHNSDIRIVRNTFDGINNANRNGISIIDGQNVAIEKNKFVHVTRADMPGPIDIEPNRNAFHVVRNIRVVGNRFEASGGNVAHIGIVLKRRFSIQPEHFVIADNTFSGTSQRGFAIINSEGYSRPLDVVFSGNSGELGQPWMTRKYADGIDVIDNDLAFTTAATFGVKNRDRVERVRVKGNSLNGQGARAGIVVHSGSHIRILNNSFHSLRGPTIEVGGRRASGDDIQISGNAAGAQVDSGIEFNGGVFRGVAIIDNDYSQVSSRLFRGWLPYRADVRGNLGPR